MCKLSASVICANPLDLQYDLNACVKGGIDQLHFDMMDGIFVPRFGLYPEILQQIKKNFNVPVDVHMMTDRPEQYVELFSNSGADYFVFHLESTYHPTRIINSIKKQKMIPGVAINPSTPVSLLENLIGEINYVCVMMIDPGILNSRTYNFVYEKIKSIDNLFKAKDISNYTIQVDGGVKVDTVKNLINAGANNLVCGTSTIFSQDKNPIDYKIELLRKIISQNIESI